MSRSWLYPRLRGGSPKLRIDVVGAFYEDSFRTILGDTIFARQHGRWRAGYRTGGDPFHAARSLAAWA